MVKPYQPNEKELLISTDYQGQLPTVLVARYEPDGLSICEVGYDADAEAWDDPESNSVFRIEFTQEETRALCSWLRDKSS